MEKGRSMPGMRPENPLISNLQRKGGMSVNQVKNYRFLANGVMAAGFLVPLIAWVILVARHFWPLKF